MAGRVVIALLDSRTKVATGAVHFRPGAVTLFFSDPRDRRRFCTHSAHRHARRRSSLRRANPHIWEESKSNQFEPQCPGVGELDGAET